jgi:N-acetylglutamate synthase-like GNAT family acetyltransferase
MKIQRVDTRLDSVQTRLSVLQKKCLPFDKTYDTNHGYWWIATQDGVDCAFAGLVCSPWWSDCGYLIRCGVVPDMRGQGLQKKFIRVRIRQAKALKMNWVITSTYDNPASANSLISCGFKMFNPTKPWMAKNTSYWRLKLE